MASEDPKMSNQGTAGKLMIPQELEMNKRLESGEG
jgi:hypothetical protein